MPELVPEGRAGRIVEEDVGPTELAAAVDSICDDEVIYDRLLSERNEVLAD